MNIHLLPLGTCAANLTSHQAYSSYLVKIQSDQHQYSILMDAGTDRVLNFEYYSPETLEIFLLSHQHLDHSRFFVPLISQLQNLHRTKILHVIAHKRAIAKLISKLKRHLKGIIPAFLEFHQIDLNTDLNQIQQISPFLFKLSELNSLSILIHAQKAIHTKDSLAFRVWIREDLNSAIQSLDYVYSPDTKFTSDHLATFAQNTDYWMLDTTFSNEILEKSMKRRFLVHAHCSPKYSGRLCEKAHAKTYLVIHYFWKRFANQYVDVDRALIEDAQKEFHGKILVSHDLKEISLK
jgi:ribonuclease BN (tRNA processing enzyme)